MGLFRAYVGSKTKFLAKHAHLLPTPEVIAARGGVYREPFLGGGALALGRYAGRCPVALSDANALVIGAYRAVRDQHEALAAALAVKATQYSRETFEAARDGLNAGIADPIEEAVAVFVLLAWGYNGLFRVAKTTGLINTTFGKPAKPGAVPRLYDPTELREHARVLRDAAILIEDFDPAALKATRGDFVDLDPPYEPLDDTSDFVGYQTTWKVARPLATATQPGLFAAADVADTESSLSRLVKVCEQFDARGVEWAVHNNDTPVTRAAFACSRWHVTSITRSGSVSSKTEERGEVAEILVRNYGRHVLT